MNKNKRIAPNVIRGGVAIPLKSNYFLMKGKTHREGGIDVGKDLEVEDGEVMKITKNNIKVLSAKPILNGTSPAEYATNGNIRKRFEQAFRAQERFKRINGLNDDGTKKENGGEEYYEELKPLLSIKEANRKETKNIARKYAASDYAKDILNDNIIIGGKNTKQEKRFNRLFNKFYNNNLEYTNELLENRKLIEEAKKGNIESYKKYITKGTDKVAKKIANTAMIIGPSMASGGIGGALIPDIIDTSINLMSGNYIGAGINVATSILPDFISKPISNKIVKKYLNKNINNIKPELINDNRIIKYNPKIKEYDSTISFKNAKRILNKNIKTPAIIELPQMSKSSTRKLIKDFNLKFAKKYGYEPIPLNLEFDEAKQAIKEIGNRHNSFIRGVSDPMTNTRLTKGERKWIKDTMKKEGLDWYDYDDRIKFALEYHAPSFKFFGRADIAHDELASVDDLGNLIYRDKYTIYDKTPNTKYIGTSYASNSIAQGAGYTYDKGKIGLVRRHFELSNNPYDWKTDIDFILNREYKRDRDVNNYENLLYEYVTGRNLNSDISKKLNIGKLINEQRNKLNDYLYTNINEYNDNLFNETFKLYKRNRYFEEQIANLKPIKFIDGNIVYEINKYAKKHNLNFRAEYPKTIKDKLYLGKLFKEISVGRNPKTAFKNTKQYLKSIEFVKNQPLDIDYNKIKDELFEKYLVNEKGKWLPKVHEFYDKMHKNGDIFTNMNGTYYSKNKIPYTRHYISKGEVGTKAWDLIRYLNTDEIDGIISRIHIDTGYSPIVTRKTKQLGGMMNNKQNKQIIPSTGYRKKTELGEVMKVDENGNLIADIEPAVVTARKPLNEIVQSELIRRILLNKIKLFDDEKIPTYKIKSSINKKRAKLGTEEPIKLKEVVVIDTKKEMPKITTKATTKDPGIIKVENSNNKPKVLPKLNSSLLTKKAIIGPLKLNKDNKEKVIELPEVIVQDTKKPMPDIKSKATTKDPGIIIPKRRNNQKKISNIDSFVFDEKAKSLKSNGIIYVKKDTNKRIENIDSSKLLNDEIKAKSNNEVQLASYKKEKTVNDNKDKVSYLEANPTFLPNLIGAGINVIGSGISYGINKKFLNELKAPKAPYLLQPTKLKTRINIKPQVNELKRTINRYNKYFDKNTASSQTAVGRRLLNEQTYIDNYNQLYGAKENQETQLINQDRLQQHETAKYNLTNYNNWLREKTNFENSVREKKSENAQMLTQNIAGSLTNFLDKQAQWKESMANIAALSAAYPDVTPEYMAEQGLPYALWLKQKRERKNNR